ncbi:hypothetical protein Fmac_032624 [Flemingia macrophylla]|uniref:Uncharacterized protein n=1 Tax=Flemingia macrophylla TaxID=520843 RepID=A0ABD1L5F1_9FABA
MANKDMDKYYNALDKALMRFHTMKIEFDVRGQRDARWLGLMEVDNDGQEREEREEEPDGQEMEGRE